MTESVIAAPALLEGGHAAGAGLGAVAAGPAWVLLVPALPLLGVVLATLSAIFGVKSKLPAWLSVLALAGAFATVVAMWLGFDGTAYQVNAWHWFDVKSDAGATFSAQFGFYVDSLTIYWMLFVTGLATLIALYASEYMSHDVGTGYCRFFAAFNLFVFSMTCLVMGSNMLMLYLGWEGVGLCSYLLIGYFYKKPAAVAAAKKAFIVNRIGDLGLALGVYLTFVHFGTIEYAELFASDKLQGYLASAQAGDFAAIPAIAEWIPLLLMIGAFGKSAQFPLYVWLPDAMEGPTPVSALIHAATMVTAGVYLIARTYPMFLAGEHALPIVAWVGTITALLAATIGMAQFDIKRIMAYSTVSQLGYMFAGLGVLTTTGAAFHVLTHAFFKALLFLACGAVMHGFAGQLDLRRLSGLGKMKGWGIVTVGMLIGCLNLSGFPMTAGYFSKDMILAEAFVTPGAAAIGWLLLLTAGLTAYYTFRVFFRVFMGPKHYEPGDDLHGDAGDFHPHAPGWAINTVLAVLAIGSLAASGLYFVGGNHDAHTHHWADTMIQQSSAEFASPYGAHHEGDGHHAVAGPRGEHEAGSLLGFDPHKAMYYVSAVFGVVGIALAWWFHLAGRTSAAACRMDGLARKFEPIPTWAEHKWYVDELYDALLRRPLRVVSHVFRLIDTYLVDGVVNLLGAVPRALAWWVRPTQSGLLHQYAIGMASGLAVILLVVMLALRIGGGG